MDNPLPNKIVNMPAFLSTDIKSVEIVEVHCPQCEGIQFELIDDEYVCCLCNCTFSTR